MNSLDIFRALLGRDPYRWQNDLFLLLLQGEIPDALDIPTGLGKTAIIAIWTAARILGARLPRRLVYVVDRRAVVDQASAEAVAVASKLETMLALMPVDQRDDWRRTLGMESNWLPISTLRGQFADNRLWLQNPAQCSIVVGTVDMIGSRVLFEGYGVSPRMRSVHAALLGTDSLVVVDEAHLVPPFKLLLRQIASWKAPKPVPRMSLMALSATGGATPGEQVFTLTTVRREDPAVRSRVNSPKKIALHASDALESALSSRAFELGLAGGRVLVFCNSRDKLARKIFETLRKRTAKEWKDQHCTALLVGARRVAEREALTGRRHPGTGEWALPPDPVFQRFQTPTDPSSSGAPAFLVATSAGEVGVDLDADHMVCDLVSWERMVQRLGRVNRSGRDAPALVDVFVAPPADDSEDEIADLAATLRAPFDSPLWTPDEDGRRDGSPGTLLDLKSRSDFDQLCRQATTPEPLCPELRRAHIEAWAMTSLDQHPGRPNVEPWIRGWIDTEPQCQLVWRHILPMRGHRPDKKLLTEFFEAFPPHRVEILQTEVYRVIELLKARVKALPTEIRKALEPLAAVVLDTKGKVEEVLGLSGLTGLENLAGRTLVIDSRLGGLSTDGLLDDSASAPPETLDDLSEEDGLWQTLRESVGRLARVVPEDEPVIRGWITEASWAIDPADDDEIGTEWRVEKKIAAEGERDSARSLRNQILGDHLNWAEKEAHALATALGLSASHEELLVTAARVHDLGKDRDLWQTAMGAPREKRPFAKVANARSNGRALGGYRHEFGSLSDGADDVGWLPPELRDLALHLVAAHHGLARPVIAPIDPNIPPSLSAPRARDAALRFARLQTEWGPWGLAWWETLLRAVDWKASAKLDASPATEKAN